jgi:polysaccharide export outer membrane protein
MRRRWADLAQMARPSEAETESEFINPTGTLSRIGWHFRWAEAATGLRSYLAPANPPSPASQGGAVGNGRLGIPQTGEIDAKSHRALLSRFNRAGLVPTRRRENPRATTSSQRLDVPNRIQGVTVLGTRSAPRWETARSVPMRAFAAGMLLGLCLLASGCSGINAKPVTEAERQALEKAAAGSPQLQAGEKIHVTVDGEAALSGDYQIDPSGFVALPLAGTIKAAGLTPHDLEQELTKKFSSGYLKNPKITVGIAEFRPFYIVGEVQKPGAYPYTSGLTVSSAIAIAGGTTYRATQSSVFIQHPGEASMREYDPSQPIPILPGDIIQIPRRYI